MSANHTHFGELYRSAFAERDPDRKLELLGQVRKALDEWEQVAQRGMERSAPARPQPRSTPGSPTTSVQVA